jgi:hypothetical protein
MSMVFKLIIIIIMINNGVLPHILIIITLVGGIPTPLKNMTSSVGGSYSQYMEKIKNDPNHQPD